MPSLLNTIENIGNDILIGVEVAAPILDKFVPSAAPILTDIATVIQALENAAVTVEPDQLSKIVQATATTAAIKQLPRA
jgi:hypothetical protein